MGWDDLPGFELDLAVALRAFDRAEVDRLCRHLVARLRSESAPPPDDRAASILQRLREKRRFEAVALVADALLESGLRSPRISLQYAQALVEVGHLAPAEVMLRSLAGTVASSRSRRSRSGDSLDASASSVTSPHRIPVRRATARSSRGPSRNI